MADKAANAEQLALVLEPFLDNAETYLEALGKIADGQVTWTEIRKKFGSKVGNAIAKIRKLNAEFGSEMEQLDAKDRAAMLKIETKRQHGLAEIASESHRGLTGRALATREQDGSHRKSGRGCREKANNPRITPRKATEAAQSRDSRLGQRDSGESASCHWISQPLQQRFGNWYG